MLRTVETYVSYQGEGPNTTRPTLFVRFAGCNFKCAGWACDTQHAIDPKIFRTNQQYWARPEDLADHLLSFETNNICLTGGEVFLQNQKDLAQTLRAVRGHYEGCGEQVNVEAFTNGALRWEEEVTLLIDNFIVDWKLPGSGEEYTPDGALQENLNRLSCLDAIKFTIKDRTDFEEAKRRYLEHIKPIPTSDRPLVYAGVVWDAMTSEELAGWILNTHELSDWRLNVQVHKYIWHPDKQGV